MIRSTLITPPVIEPVSVPDAKEQATVEHTEHDAMFERLIQAAREEAEQRTGRALLSQVWQQRGDAEGNVVFLRRWPVLDVVSVSDERGLLDASAWQAERGDFPVVIATEGFQGTVTVEYAAGYGDAPSDVPTPIRQWILATVSAMYEHREKAVSGTITSEFSFLDGLLDPYRVQPV